MKESTIAEMLRVLRIFGTQFRIAAIVSSDCGRTQTLGGYVACRSLLSGHGHNLDTLHVCASIGGAQPLSTRDLGRDLGYASDRDQFTALAFVGGETCG